MNLKYLCIYRYHRLVLVESGLLFHPHVPLFPSELQVETTKNCIETEGKAGLESGPVDLGSVTIAAEFLGEECAKRNPSLEPCLGTQVSHQEERTNEETRFYSALGGRCDIGSLPGSPHHRSSSQSFLHVSRSLIYLCSLLSAFFLYQDPSFLWAYMYVDFMQF